MPWIESHQDLRDHPKTVRFRRRLGVPLPTAIGHLHMLWWWALSYADDGDLSQHEDDVIAEACGFEGDASAFVEALVYAGFLDEDRRVHDWDDYAGRLVEKREANAQRMRQARAARRARISGERAENVQRTSDERAPDVRGLPDRTQPDRTQPDRTPTPQPPPATQREGESALPRAKSAPERTNGNRTGPSDPAPAATAHGPPRRRSNGATRRSEPVLNGREGWMGCPAGCPTNHGGPRASNHLGEDWLAIPPDDRPSWREHVARHGRPDLADVPAPTPAQLSEA